MDDLGEYEHLVITADFESSLYQLAAAEDDYEFADDEVNGVWAALATLDAAPATQPGELNLHVLKRERRPWWSITPNMPAGTSIRILVQPARVGNAGVWLVGPVTRHYQSAPS